MFLLNWRNTRLQQHQRSLFADWVSLWGRLSSTNGEARSLRLHTESSRESAPPARSAGASFPKINDNKSLMSLKCCLFCGEGFIKPLETSGSLTESLWLHAQGLKTCAATTQFESVLTYIQHMMRNIIQRGHAQCRTKTVTVQTVSLWKSPS